MSKLTLLSLKLESLCGSKTHLLYAKTTAKHQKSTQLYGGGLKTSGHCGVCKIQSALLLLQSRKGKSEGKERENRQNNRTNGNRRTGTRQRHAALKAALGPGCSKKMFAFSKADPFQRFQGECGSCILGVVFQRMPSLNA